MNLPTIQEMFDEAEDKLERIYCELSTVRDVLNSDWSDNRWLTDEEADRRDRMQKQIAAAKQAVETAKTRKQ